IPSRIQAQYPREMTIVLQHQFWDLRFDREAQAISVGLSFGGVPTTLTIPLASVVEFADPHVRYGLRFQPAEPPEASPAPEAAAEPEPPAPEQPPAPAEPAQVVSLDAFRRRTPQG
ncbi:MAG: ClpXP protease specificity-enhancing factor SspB, partial [Rhodopila sp.]